MTFKTYQQGFAEETIYRNGIEFNTLCKYGIQPLDDALLAIAPSELIVIAAGSGIGKTELALNISRKNALIGKKVAHYNLEGGLREAIQRMKWRDICDKYYSQYASSHTEMDYRAWVLNKDPNELLIKLEAEVYTEMQDKIGKRLFLYDSRDGLNCKSFCESLITLDGLRCDLGLSKNVRDNLRGIVDIDLIVIDHLHYFSLDKDENEIAEITEVLKTVKKITEEMNIPVVLVAHLRKLPRGHGIPDKEDIYGTSNIHKIANTCVVIAPDHDNDDIENGIYPTYFRIAKSRQGLRPNILMSSKFNIKTRRYEDGYDLFRCFPNGEVSAESIPHDNWPHWAKNGQMAAVRGREAQSTGITEQRVRHEDSRNYQ